MGGRTGPAPPKVDTAKSLIAVKITYQAYWTAVVGQSPVSADTSGIPRAQADGRVRNTTT
ncbi:hypothetical protein [Paenarthrobacter sp. 2TAF44]|uniref:hypothetical protein n=1 Tax=Paenarthrobacter sp. 2TAF44 TaxID=3233018 RepID=UPI003F9D191D